MSIRAHAVRIRNGRTPFHSNIPTLCRLGPLSIQALMFLLYAHDLLVFPVNKSFFYFKKKHYLFIGYISCLPTLKEAGWQFFFLRLIHHWFNYRAYSWKRQRALRESIVAIQRRFVHLSHGTCADGESLLLVQSVTHVCKATLLHLHCCLLNLLHRL